MFGERAIELSFEIAFRRAPNGRRDCIEERGIKFREGAGLVADR
jgi:hypothetical protein